MSYTVKSGIKAWAEDDQPREKLLLKGNNALSDAELIAILVRIGSNEMSAVDLSKKILQSVDNNLNQLWLHQVDILNKIHFGIRKTHIFYKILQLILVQLLLILNKIFVT